MISVIYYAKYGMPLENPKLQLDQEIPKTFHKQQRKRQKSVGNILQSHFGQSYNGTMSNNRL